MKLWKPFRRDDEKLREALAKREIERKLRAQGYSGKEARRLASAHVASKQR